MYEVEFHAPYYAYAPGGVLKPSFVIESFQEAACRHADSRSCGIAELLSRGLTWVMRRYSVRFIEPVESSSLIVRTWYQGYKNFMSMRSFDARDASGRVVATALSSWILLDVVRMHPTRLATGLPEAYFSGEDTADAPQPDRLRASGEPESILPLTVRRHELDMNGHANHTAYFDWIFESVPDEVYDLSRPVALEAEYLHAVMRGEVECGTRRVGDDPVRYEHSLVVIGEDGTRTTAARFESTWQRVQR